MRVSYRASSTHKVSEGSFFRKRHKSLISLLCSQHEQRLAGFRVSRGVDVVDVYAGFGQPGGYPAGSTRSVVKFNEQDVRGDRPETVVVQYSAGFFGVRSHQSDDRFLNRVDGADR